MKKSNCFCYRILPVALCAAMLGGCGASAASSSAAESTDSTDSAPLKVMASFYPMYDFAQKIGGDKVTVTNMVPAGTEPHDWEPSTTDITNLEDADVFIYSGAGMEHWVDSVLGSLTTWCRPPTASRCARVMRTRTAMWAQTRMSGWPLPTRKSR